MSAYLTFLLEQAARDPRLPGFQCITVHRDASVRVIYQHGTHAFPALEYFHLWLVQPTVPAGQPAQALPSPS